MLDLMHMITRAPPGRHCLVKEGFRQGSSGFCVAVVSAVETAAPVLVEAL